MKLFKNLAKSKINVFEPFCLLIFRKLLVYSRQHLLTEYAYVVLTRRASSKGQTGSVVPILLICLYRIGYAADRLVFQFSSYTSRNWPGDSDRQRSLSESNSR